MLRQSFRAVPKVLSGASRAGSAAFSANSWGEILDGTVPATSDPRSRHAMSSLVQELKANVEKVHLGGGEKAQERHRSRGKLVARDRVNGLLDPGTPFLELGTLAGFDMYDDWIPSGGIVTGIGCVKGWVFCAVIGAPYISHYYSCQ